MAHLFITFERNSDFFHASGFNMPRLWSKLEAILFLPGKADYISAVVLHAEGYCLLLIDNAVAELAFVFEVIR
jgi:hypothetical protein